MLILHVTLAVASVWLVIAGLALAVRGVRDRLRTTSADNSDGPK